MYLADFKGEAEGESVVQVSSSPSSVNACHTGYILWKVAVTGLL